MASHGEFQPATETKAVNRRDNWNPQILNTVEEIGHLLDRILHLCLTGEGFKIANIGAGDKARLLAGDDHEPAHVRLVRRVLNGRNDLGQLLQRALAECIHALVFAIESSPGNPLEIDMECPIFKIG
ncbi:hypothetical protein MnTg02_00997 [bacterium MnTg02]|nr:hypothetical protein MnTg02_00997 [bacterium MnTg02]